MTYLLDTDHITILQRETGQEYATLQTRLAQYPPTELAFPIISLHEQVVGCHTYINQARNANARGGWKQNLGSGEGPTEDCNGCGETRRSVRTCQRWKSSTHAMDDRVYG